MSSRYYAGVGSGPIFVYRSNCGGSESSIDDCSLTMHSGSDRYCNHFDDVSVRCFGKYLTAMFIICTSKFLHY